MALLYLVVLVLTVVYLLYKLSTRNYDYWKERNVAGPRPLPLVGNTLDLVLRRKNEAELLMDVYNQFPEEKVIGFFKASIPYLVVKDLDLIKQIMIKEFDMFTDRGIGVGVHVLSKNLFLAEGKQWQVLRARCTPLFTSGRLRAMLPLIVKRADAFVAHVADLVSARAEHEVHGLLQKYTLATISACAFGLDMEIGKQVEELEMINKLVFRRSRIGEVLGLVPGLRPLLGRFIISSRIMDYFTGLVRLVVAQRNGVPSDRRDFMDLMLELKQQGQIKGANHNYEETELEIDEELMAAQAFVFYTAGYETSATTMHFMLYQLALNPDIQEKLLAEVDAVMKRHGGQVTYESLNEMKYMTMVFDETLRMYPVADPLQRRARADWHAPGPGSPVMVPRGGRVLVPVTAIHHDPRHYPDPERFDPERFTPENSCDRHVCAYMPFGQGPRNCIGMRFAKVQSQVCMAMFLHRFRVEPSRHTPAKVAYDPHAPIVGSLGGIRLNILPRNKHQ